MDVIFTWKDKQYSAELRPVSGAGTIYHLMIKNYYQGQLTKTELGWQFSTQKHGYLPELSMQLGRYVQHNLLNDR